MALFDPVGLLVKLEREWRMLDPERVSSKSPAKACDETLGSRQPSWWLRTDGANPLAANDA